MEIETINSKATNDFNRGGWPRGRPRIKILKHVISDRKITDLVAESMGHRAENAAKNIGIYVDLVRYIRKMIIISKHHMAAEDRIKLQYCFDTLNSERSIGHVRLIANQIIKKYWVRAKPPKDSRRYEVEKFDRTLFAIHEVCETAAELNIPFGYSVEQVKMARMKVNAARRALVTLKSKLEGRGPKEVKDE